MTQRAILRATEDITGGLNLTGSPNVFINGKPVVRIGDQVAAYGTHSVGSMATGSTTLFVNGLAVCRVGDTSTNGGTAVLGGVATVFTS